MKNTPKDRESKSQYGKKKKKERKSFSMVFGWKAQGSKYLSEQFKSRVVANAPNLIAPNLDILQ